MQILKRITRHCETGGFAAHHPICITKQSRRFLSKKSQNLIEFIFVFPMLLFISLAIMEVALFWQDVNTIYNLNAEINANAALLTYTGMSAPNPTTGTPGSVCPAANDTILPTGDPEEKHSAINTLKRIDSAITLTKPTYKRTIAKGKNEPFVLYKFEGGPEITASNGEQASQITLWVDCRNPFEDGVTTQLEFYHKTLIMRASIPRFDKPEPIVIIPDKIFIASPKLNTLRHY